MIQVYFLCFEGCRCAIKKKEVANRMARAVEANKLDVAEKKAQTVETKK